MARTAVILGESAAVVISIARVAPPEPANVVTRTTSAQPGIAASQGEARFAPGMSRFRDAGFTEREINEIGFVLLGSLGAWLGA